MGKEAKKYLEDVRLAFPVAYKDEKRFLRDIEDSVYTYEEQNPECSQEDLHEAFGEPKDVALGYYHATSIEVYFGMMKRSKYMTYITRGLIVFLIALLLLTVGFYVYATNQYKENTGRYVDTEVETIWDTEVEK